MLTTEEKQTTLKVTGRFLWPFTISVLLLSLVFSVPVFAQETDDDDSLSDDELVEEVIVTGSKLRRDSFSSISPVQVIGGQESARIGAVDTATMIAESPVVFGPQLDGSVNAGSTTGAVEGVPANGPGAATVALRGLGAERTLLLVNGRRLAPSGVRGAPVAPDLNLIPSSLIDRIEILTDGASSIYGADAVAGVANIILRRNFEGLEMKAFSTFPEESGGEEVQFSMIGGATGDRSSFMMAAEYFDRSTIFADQRRDWNDCQLDIEVAPDGQEYSVCQSRAPDNGAFIFSQGFVYNTPGMTDIGVMNWSTNAGAAAILNHGFDDVLLGNADQTPYNLQQEFLDTQLQGNIERINLYATGEFNWDFWNNDRIYFEGSYSQRQNTDYFTSEQAFPAINPMIPMVDANGDVVGMVDNPNSPFDEAVLPVYTLAGLTQHRETDIDNFRFVAGMDGTLGNGDLARKNWVYDVFVSYEESSGTSVQAGMHEGHIRESLDTVRMLPDGSLTCGLPRTEGGFGFITPSECVVVDWFANSLFTTAGGDKTFATDAENDWLFGNVINTTQIQQTHFSALVTGDLFEMPAGTVGIVLGAEWRENSIDSANDIIRKFGESASEAPDQERDTIGETSIWDVYLETELPLTEDLVVNLSGRYTDEENFGSEFTYSTKVAWQVLDSLRLRGTYGTTFRAPNLREQFLAGQAGVLAGNNDPCVVPTTANDGGVYNPDGDDRSQRVINNCVADGVDPTALGLQANVLIPTETGGSSDIGAETSKSYTLGFVFEQPWTDAYSLEFSLNYFNIDIEDTVEELDASTILARCYNDEDNLASGLCSRVVRRGVNASNNTVARVDSSFVNLGLVTSSGMDINARFIDEYDLFGHPTDFMLDFTGTYYDALEEQLDDQSPVDDRVGEAGRPEFSWIGRALFSTGNWEYLWRTRWIDEFSKDAEDITESRNRSVSACNAMGGPVADTGNGPCVKKASGDSVWYHDLSVSYLRDSWSVTGGIRNIFGEEPPLITQGEGPSRQNFVVQSTYDLFGRRLFVNLTKTF
jgi:iron complex outermembrane receptor protein